MPFFSYNEEEIQPLALIPIEKISTLCGRRATIGWPEMKSLRKKCLNRF